MTYAARCKHCEHFRTERQTKKDGTLSKRRAGFCGLKNGFTPERTLACDNFK